MMYIILSNTKCSTASFSKCPFLVLSSSKITFHLSSINFNISSLVNESILNVSPVSNSESKSLSILFSIESCL